MAVVRRYPRYPRVPGSPATKAYTRAIIAGLQLIAPENALGSGDDSVPLTSAIDGAILVSAITA